MNCPVNSEDVSIRRARSTDSEFAYEALLTIRPYVEATWGSWLEADGRARTELDAKTGRSQIIQLVSVPVGLLCVDEFGTHLSASLWSTRSSTRVEYFNFDPKF